MKILVPVKRVLDPERAAAVLLAPCGRGFSAPGIEYKPNPFDEYAVEAALRIMEHARTPTEIVLVSIGPKEAEVTLRQCLALGAHRAILVDTDSGQSDSSMVAEILAELARRESPDLIIAGKQAVDDDACQVPQMLSELLGWPGAVNASQMTIGADETSATLHCGIDGGVLRVRVRFPAVVSVDLRIVAPSGVLREGTAVEYSDGPRFASLRAVMAARKKPLETVTPSFLGVSLPLRTTVISCAMAPSEKNCSLLSNVDELMARLAIIRGDV